MNWSKHDQRDVPQSSQWYGLIFVVFVLRKFVKCYLWAQHGGQQIKNPLTLEEQFPLISQCILFCTYLSSQMSLLDLRDVGVCCIKGVKIHFVELIVELLSKLPRQVIMAERSESKRSHVHRAPFNLNCGFISREENCLFSMRNELLLQNILFKVHCCCCSYGKQGAIIQTRYPSCKRRYHLPINERGLRHQLQSFGQVLILGCGDGTGEDPQHRTHSWDKLRQHFFNFYTVMWVSLLCLCVPKPNLKIIPLNPTLTCEWAWFYQLLLGQISVRLGN